LKLLVNILRWT